MGKFGNISYLICQCNGLTKVTDTEKSQEIERLLLTSYRLYEESESLKKKSEEYGDKAIKLILSEGIEVDNLLIRIKEMVLKDGET